MDQQPRRMQSVPLAAPRAAASATRPNTASREVAPAIVPPGQKLEDAERLQVENLYLKMVNCQLRVQALDRQKEDTVNEMRSIQQQLDEYRKGLSAKYGVDISRGSVTPDGYIKGPPQAATAPAADVAAPAQEPEEPPAPAPAAS